MGEHVKALAKVLSDLVGNKLNARASMHALVRLAVAAFTAYVATWEGMTDLSGMERGRVYRRLSPIHARVRRKSGTADQPRTRNLDFRKQK